MNKYAIIVAGGKGLRMQTETPKQFLLLKNMPVLMHTIRQFAKSDQTTRILLVLPSDHFSTWQQLVNKYNFEVAHEMIEGGNTRFESVRNGLNAIKEDGLVAIHDGVRPLISTSIIEKSYNQADEYGNAIVSVALKDSIRRLENETNRMEDRSSFRLMQTPQTFKVELIKSAFSNATHVNFTDDASVLENDGHQVHLIDGDYRNIKITTKEDLIIADALLDQ